MTPPIPPPVTTVGVLRHAAARDPDGLAVQDGARSWTFGSLCDEVEAVAAGLVATGLRRGDRVALQAPNSGAWIVAALATHLAGGVLVPLNTRAKGEESADVLRRSGARLLFTVRSFLGVDFAAAVERAGALPERVVYLDELPVLVMVGEGTSSDLLPGPDPDDPSDVLYTSGTTGRPKGVVTTHRQSVETFRAWAEIVGLEPRDRYLVVPPFFHTFGYKAGWLACLLVGCTCLPHAVFDAAAVAARIRAEAVTVLPGPPALYQALLAEPGPLPLRVAVTGAAVVPESLVRALFDRGLAVVLTAYGLTECTGVATMCRRGDPPALIAGTSGRAIPGVEVRVVDAEGGVLPPGEPGEVQVRGPNVMRGYLDDPAATAQALRDGWLATGDVGVLDAGGNLRITDRLKDMYIVGGFNVYPAELERVLQACPGVQEIAVVGVPDERLGEVGCAFVVGDAPGLPAYAAERLANYKVPRRWVQVEALPRNASGKVLKTTLRERACSTG